MGGYIGASAGGVANAAERKQTYSITTATTSLTGLAYTPTKVHVFHNGVRLVDSTDYTATNGTSITLTNAAQNGDEVVVISYPSFQTSDTVSAANGGTFAGNVAMSGTLGVTGITTATGGLNVNTIKDSSATSTALTIDSTGTVLLPNQPAFLAQKNAAQNNIATSTLVTVDFNSEIFDQNSDYDTSTSTFTAPVTGRYLITCHILMEAVDTAADYYQLRLVTSNRIHYSTKDWGGYSSDPAYGVLDVIVITDMDANDTLYAAIYQQSGSAQTDLNTTTCTFSACLLA